jgi:hypothetical protein
VSWNEVEENRKKRRRRVRRVRRVGFIRLEQQKTRKKHLINKA